MTFIPGLELNRGYYGEVVAPLVAEGFPRVRHSAALIGYGSDVLGFDTPISMDHNWGPRLQLFLSPDDMTACGAKIAEYLRRMLPFSYRGFPTNFCAPRYDGTQTMEATAQHPVNHLIEVTTVPAYLERHLGGASIDRLSPDQWGRLDDQRLLELTAGKVFHDGLGELERMRERLAFFPHEVLILRLLRLWKGIEEDEPLVGRLKEAISDPALRPLL